jgi:hypothetical protein
MSYYPRLRAPRSGVFPISKKFVGGLKLSREYFFKVAQPLLKHEFPELYPRLAVGLAGKGSECFGYDDKFSRDSDWGVDFHIWTLSRDRGFIPVLNDWKDGVFATYPSDYPHARSDHGARGGIMTCGDFYSSLIGVAEGPRTLNECLRVPEENFAMAVNGEVFYDGPGEFTKTRNYILGYYPEDIRKKRIAAKCISLAQTGQYNHERTAKRRDRVTLNTVLSRFTDSSIAMAFLLCRVYKPYYKLAYRALSDLPEPGGGTARLLLKIAETDGTDEKSLSKRQRFISELCAIFVSELKAQGLSDSDETLLTPHGEAVQRTVQDIFLRSLPTQYDI